MKTILIAAVILCGFTGLVVAQKKDTFIGTMVIGEVAGTAPDTREITIKYPGKEGTETFSGILADGYKLKMKDGSSRELKIDEITPGIRVKVLYKTKHENVGGQKKKINRIFSIEFLGRDEFSRLRTQLNINPSTVVVHAKDDHLPSVSPIKVFLAIAYDNIRLSVVDWITKWNSKHGDSHGRLELVSDLDRADVLMVIAEGSDTMVAAIQTQYYSGDSVVTSEFSKATLYLVLKDPEKLKVLWTSVVPILISDQTANLSRSRGSITSEMEKRMKARSSNLKK